MIKGAENGATSCFFFFPRFPLIAFACAHKKMHTPRDENENSNQVMCTSWLATFSCSPTAILYCYTPHFKNRRMTNLVRPPPPFCTQPFAQSVFVLVLNQEG